jgi:two-component system sensor histidine kinase BaeS
MKSTVARKLLVTTMFIPVILVSVNLFYGHSLDQGLGTDLMLLAIVAFVITAGASVLLARHVLAGIQVLVDGVHKLANGEMDTRIELTRTDELGDLAREFNNLADGLAKQNRAQKQWIADTSHELRTPLSILRAQVEAFQDGVQEVSQRNLSILHSDIMALSKLAEDLHWLARFDVGQLKHTRVPTDIIATLHEVIEAYEERFEEKGIAVDKSQLKTINCIVDADGNRLKQVFFNLVENSLRYTNTGGTLKVTCEKTAAGAVLHFDDSEPGVPQEMLPQIFERFFRVESSRSRTYGGAGLGLPICKNIIELHRGSIEAFPSPLGGIRIEIRLPLLEPNKHV